MVDPWIRRILAREGVREDDVLDLSLGYGSFQEFSRNELPGPTEQTVHVPGEDNHYTVSAFFEGSDLNCIGTAVVGGIVGTAVYGEDLEVVTEYRIGADEINPWKRDVYPQVIQEHVSLQDADGNIFGGSLGVPEHERQALPPEYLDGLHLASMISDYRARGRNDAADRLYDELKGQGLTSSEYINRQLNTIPG